MRLAVVSSDGENVDLHLGKGSSIYIYDYEETINRANANSFGDFIERN